MYSFKSFRYCVWAGLFLGAVGAKAQTSQPATAVYAHSFSEKTLLAPYTLLFYADPSGSMALSDIRKADFKGWVGIANLPQPLRPNASYWAKFTLKSHLTTHSDWVLFLGFVSRAEIYSLDEEGKFRRQQTGFFVPNAQQQVREGAENKVVISLLPKATATIFIKFKNVLNYPPEPVFALQARESWQAELGQDHLYQGIFQGLLWMLLIYNLFLFGLLGDRAYLYYIVFIFFISAYFGNEYGYSEYYFLPNQPEVSFYLATLIYPALVFFVQFNRTFLHLPREHPQLDRFAQVWLSVSILFMLACLPLAYWAYDWYVPIRNGYHLIYALLLTVFTLLVLGVKDALAAFFILANFCVLAGGVFIVMGNLEAIPFNLYYLLGGIVGQLLIFSLALGYRYRRNMEEQQKTQTQLIAQLQENEQLQTKVNRELEDKVWERTQEIERQNKLLENRQVEIEAKNTELAKKNQEVQHAYHKITDSVRYAQRLQKAIIGEEAQIGRYFTEAFMLFMPRDVVSGDFYWFGQIHHLKIAIVADCTGHGIPGALMTMLGCTALHEIINERQITVPHEILQELDEKVTSALEKQTTSDAPKDGMDVIVLVFDPLSHTVRFSGAINPLYYVRNTVLHQVKATSLPIGLTPNRKAKDFELHEWQYEPEDVFYLCTDGFQDQFGGTENTKYLKKRFREFLQRHSHFELYQQREKLLYEFIEWKGSHQQTDDVLIVGLKG
jgi:serine phosphatase RsbU (regulator of sigma subunit)